MKIAAFVCLYIHSRSNEKDNSLKIWYKDAIKGFWEVIEAIFSKIDVNFLFHGISTFDDFFNREMALFDSSILWTKRWHFNMLPTVQ